MFFEEDLRAKKDVDDTEAAVAERKRRLQQVESRKSLALDVMEIFAYSGDDAKAYQHWIKEQLRLDVTMCDICSREFHRAREDLQRKLRE